MATPFFKNKVLRKFSSKYSDAPDPTRNIGYRTAQSLADDDFKIPVKMIAEIMDEFKKHHLIISDGLLPHRCKATNRARPFLRRGGYVTKYIIDGLLKKGLLREVLVGLFLVAAGFILNQQIAKKEGKAQYLKDIQQDSVSKTLKDSVQNLDRRLYEIEHKKIDTPIIPKTRP